MHNSYHAGHSEFPFSAWPWRYWNFCNPAWRYTKTSKLSQQWQEIRTVWLTGRVWRRVLKHWSYMYTSNTPTHTHTHIFHLHVFSLKGHGRPIEGSGVSLHLGYSWFEELSVATKTQQNMGAGNYHLPGWLQQIRAYAEVQRCTADDEVQCPVSCEFDVSSSQGLCGRRAQKRTPCSSCSSGTRKILSLNKCVRGLCWQFAVFNVCPGCCSVHNTTAPRILLPSEKILGSHRLSERPRALARNMVQGNVQEAARIAKTSAVLRRQFLFINRQSGGVSECAGCLQWGMGFHDSFPKEELFKTIQNIPERAQDDEGHRCQCQFWKWRAPASPLPTEEKGTWIWPPRSSPCRWEKEERKKAQVLLEKEGSRKRQPEVFQREESRGINMGQRTSDPSSVFFNEHYCTHTHIYIHISRCLLILCLSPTQQIYVHIWSYMGIYVHIETSALEHHCSKSSASFTGTRHFLPCNL